MTPVLSRAQMRAFDAHAVAKGRVPGLVLMENAGRGATDVLVREALWGKPLGARVVVVCGAGNNGGDGLVIARHLLLRGARPVVCLVGDSRKLTPDARTNFDAWLGVGGEVLDLAAGGSLSALTDSMGSADVIVDALFGTGLDRPIEGWLGGVVGAVNEVAVPRFAVDIPSGLDADTGMALGAAVEAEMTATFAHPKLGLLTPNGARLAGKFHVVDIGVPGSMVAQVGSAAGLLEPSDLAQWVVPRPSGTHKSSAGHVVVIAGSRGKGGAAQLVARGAMRAGAGLATIATWTDTASAIEAHAVEVMTARIDPLRTAGSLQEILKGKQAVAIGPGLGLGDDARAVVEYALTAWRGPVVVDADALTAFAGKPEVFRAASSAVLTPHPGEMARLLGKTPAQIESDRFGSARELVSATGAVVVLKGAHTVIAAPDARVAVSPVACSALATAGSGDVLCGIVAAMTCALPPFEAACAAVLLHALAGETWSRAHGGADRGMLASEIADALTTLRPGVG